MTAAPAEDARAHLAGLLAHLHEVAPARPTDIVLAPPQAAGPGDTRATSRCNGQALSAPAEIATRLVWHYRFEDWNRPKSPGRDSSSLLKRASSIQSAGSSDGLAYGNLEMGGKKKVQLEFVSANPTGPLHVGHGRGAAYGASLANVLTAAGFDVTREYYVNDAGRQMDILALSTWLRYLELCGVAVAFPGNAYQGEYVREMARKLHDRHKVRFNRDVPAVTPAEWPPGADEEARLDALIAVAKSVLVADYEVVYGFGLNEQLADCRSDLTEFGVDFDNWFSESSLYDSGMVERAVKMLEETGHVFTEGGAKWFRSSAFGDEKDRVVQRENGQYTYFASDIAYHLNKFERGFDQVIDVWGADHHSYILRVKGALAALGLNPGQLTIALVQFAVLYRNGHKVSMSTRAGEFVTLRELRREVGNDAAALLIRSAQIGPSLDFDRDCQVASTIIPSITSVLPRSGEQPVRAVGRRRDPVSPAPMRPPRLGAGSCTGIAPHGNTRRPGKRGSTCHRTSSVLTFWELAAVFHSYYNSTRILWKRGRQLARLRSRCRVRQCGTGSAVRCLAPEKM